MGLGMLLFFAAVLAAAAIGAHQWDQAQRRKNAAFAASLGLSYLHGPVDPPAPRFQHLSVGHSRQARRLMWRAGDPAEAVVFEYRYTTGSGKDSTTHKMTCASFKTGVGAPHLTLERQGWLRSVLGSLGLRDIEVESPEFNRRWHVSCDDERFAITFLDPPMIAWLMSLAGGAGAVELELLGDRGLAVIPTMAFQETPGLLGYCDQFVEQIPRVLHELYPETRW